MNLTTNDGIHVLTMTEGNQVLNATTLAGLNEALDQVEASTGPGALVLTGEGKTFNQGLDLPWVMGLGEGMPGFLKEVHALFGRLLRLEVPTIAAINGHAIAGGAMVAMCTDVRIMRSDRGWLRLPEVELGLPFTVVMDALIAARIPQPARHTMMVLARKHDGRSALAAGAVDDTAEGEGATLEAAIAQAAQVAAYRGPVLKRIRSIRYRDLLATIDVDGDRTDLMTP